MGVVIASSQNSKRSFPKPSRITRGGPEQIDHVVTKIGGKFYDIRGEVRGFFHPLEGKNLRVAKCFEFDFINMTSTGIDRDEVLKGA